jgi:hypothetical protein
MQSSNEYSSEHKYQTTSGLECALSVFTTEQTVNVDVQVKYSLQLHSAVESSHMSQEIYQH